MGRKRQSACAPSGECSSARSFCECSPMQHLIQAKRYHVGNRHGERTATSRDSKTLAYLRGAANQVYKTDSLLVLEASKARDVPSDAAVDSNRTEPRALLVLRECPLPAVVALQEPTAQDLPAQRAHVPPPHPTTAHVAFVPAPVGFSLGILPTRPRLLGPGRGIAPRSSSRSRNSGNSRHSRSSGQERGSGSNGSSRCRSRT